MNLPPCTTPLYDKAIKLDDADGMLSGLPANLPDCREQWRAFFDPEVLGGAGIVWPSTGNAMVAATIPFDKVVDVRRMMFIVARVILAHG